MSRRWVRVRWRWWRWFRSVGIVGCEGDPDGMASGREALPNGNVLISDYTGRRLLEVDAAGKLVHELQMGPRTVALVAVVPSRW
jgi:hypothetical protein